jgi:ADP-ribosyl-[dinitrogen reductase] hydrolase
MNGEAIVGCMLGTAVGDALGLPYEGIGPRRLRRMFPELGRHHFLLGHGMISDDTEHTCFAAQAMLSAHGNPDEFERQLASSLRWWLIGIPAGVGLATLRACSRLWMGIPPTRSGVFSAGNGPAMRSALLGVAYGDDPARLREHVLRSTRITHSDPKAFYGALAVALAAHRSCTHAAVTPADFLAVLRSQLSEEGAGEFLALMGNATLSAARGESLSGGLHLDAAVQHAVVEAGRLRAGGAPIYFFPTGAR